MTIFWGGEKKNNGYGVVVGLSLFIPPIANARWVGHPRVCERLKTVNSAVAGTKSSREADFSTAQLTMRP